MLRAYDQYIRLKVSQRQMRMVLTIPRSQQQPAACDDIFWWTGVVSGVVGGGWVQRSHSYLCVTESGGRGSD